MLAVLLLHCWQMLRAFSDILKLLFCPALSEAHFTILLITLKLLHC